MPTIIQNLLNPTEDDRRLAFEYFLALVCDDDQEEPIASIKGRVIQTSHAFQFIYLITKQEAEAMFSQKELDRQNSPFTFGSDCDGEAVEWFAIDQDSLEEEPNLKLLPIEDFERIDAYKLAHDLPIGTECEIDGSIVNVKGKLKTYNWVLDFDTEVKKVFSENYKDYYEDIFEVGGRRWIVMST